MYFKVEKGSKLYEKFLSFQNKLDNARNECLNLVTAYGAENGASRRDVEFLFGPLIGIVFPEGHKVDTKLWKIKKFKGANYWYPRKNNTAFLEAMQKLPIIKQAELCDVINYEYLQEFTLDGQMKISYSYGYTALKSKELFLLKIRHNAKYDRSPDMVEITESEFYSYFKK